MRDHLLHSRDYLKLLPPEGLVADLGSGAGVPGLIIAALRPTLAVVLIDASRKRADELERSVALLGLGTRAEVVGERAERVGRMPAWRGAMDAVVARSFGPPAYTAECAAPLLRPGGRLVVSEPEGSKGERWDGLRDGPLPLSLDRVVMTRAGTFALLTLTSACPERFPRVSASKHPLF